MTDKVNPSPVISQPFNITNIIGVLSYLSYLTRDIISELRAHAVRLNLSLVSDGTLSMDKPIPLASYAVADVPSAGSWEGSLIYISDETGGATIAFSDGTNWRRVQDRVIAS